MRDIDLEAYSFVAKISPPNFEDVPKKSLTPYPKMRGEGTEVICDLGEVQNLIMIKIDPISEHPLEYFAYVDNKCVGLNEIDYIAYSELIEYALTYPPHEPHISRVVSHA